MDKQEYVEPRFEKSILCFIDILGFKNIMEDAIEERTCEDLLKRICKALSEGKEFIHPKYCSDIIYDNERPWDIKAFTDNIILKCQINDEIEQQIFEVLTSLCFYQISLINNGFLVRGGIGVGDIYMDDNIVFGEALIDAYNAESELAEYPRIVLDLKADVFIQKIINHKGCKADEISSLISEEDGIRYLDYLYILKEIDENGNKSLVKEILTKQKKIIIDGLEKYKENEKVLEKYIWLSKYHNEKNKTYFGGYSEYEILV